MRFGSMINRVQVGTGIPQNMCEVPKPLLTKYLVRAISVPATDCNARIASGIDRTMQKCPVKQCKF